MRADSEAHEVMRFPSETARPIMAYVRELEGKVLTLRADLRRFRATSFAAGLMVGGLGAFAICLVLRYLR